MTRQMSAERSRRALVTESEGQKQAAVTVAEGQKQAAILAAEGQRQAAILRAEGLAGALRSVGGEAPGAAPNTMLLQYLDVLREIASTPSTKLVLPMELTALLSGLRGVAEGAVSATEGAGSDGRPAVNGVAAPAHQPAVPTIS